ncbi:MAG TPA: methyltransferase domain-containing protein, partial [Actinocrinis sp.]|uniref:class I SAM-dependent methyltransferase n=1 Tax=Actinocrinis sp. TaxID=1920516 RepID=UPI002D6BC5BC
MPHMPHNDTTEAAAPAEANAAQAEAWNGDAGQHWVQYRDRREAQLSRFSPHLFAAAQIAADAQVLDVGCGCGGTTLQAARQAANGQALGVDLSAPMLAEARRRALAEEVANVAFQQADAQVHPFAPDSFDVMLSRFGVMFFADPQAAFSNLERAVRSGGSLHFLCWQSAEVNDFFTVPLRAISAHLDVPQRDTPGEPGPFSLADPDDVRGLLTAAGFDSVEINAVDERMWIGADLEDAVAYQMTTPSNQAALAEAGPEARGRVMDALREALSPYATAEGMKLEAHAWLVTARKR